jgi:hypothetical protein
VKARATRKRERGAPTNRARPLQLRTLYDGKLLEIADSGSARLPAKFLLGGQQPRDSSAQVARLAEQFIGQNVERLRSVGVELRTHFDGSSVDFDCTSANRIGAVPLLSPSSGKFDFGLIVRPRFGWPGVGAVMNATGWRVVPSPLAQPMLPRSDRKIPPWLLSSIVLFRLKMLLDSLERKFDLVREPRPAPRGTVDWGGYANRQISRGLFLQVPCQFPDLRDDRRLRSAIRFAVEAHRGSLETQRCAGIYVLKLIELCEMLRDRLRDVVSLRPRPAELFGWMRAKLKSEVYSGGIEAIEWTAEERGLGGSSDLRGLAWSMSMEEFFEAWVEVIVTGVARRTGGVVKTGRLRETIIPISWDPPYLGSQKSLVPDVELEREDLTVIVDAKYKQHWEEMQDSRWRNLDESIRERHREDLLQVLAYSTTARTPRVTVCLAYPCREETWLSLRERNQLFHRATVPAQNRRVELLLTAFPLSTRLIDEVVGETASQIARSEL